MPNPVKIVFGIGVNDADYKGVNRCPYYQRWKGMLRRCYGNPPNGLDMQYENVEVCKEWLSFIPFKSWMVQQDWRGNELDKDIIGDGSIYSPDTCCFVPKAVNALIQKQKTKKGTNQITCGKWQSRINTFGEFRSLGCFDTKQEAEAAFMRAKSNAMMQASSMVSDKRAQEALIKMAKQILEKTNE